MKEDKTDWDQCPTCGSTLEVQGHTTMSFVPVNHRKIREKEEVHSDLFAEILTDLIVEREKSKRLERELAAKEVLLDEIHSELNRFALTVMGLSRGSFEDLVAIEKDGLKTLASVAEKIDAAG